MPPEDKVIDGGYGGLERLYRCHRDKLLRFVGRHTPVDRSTDIVHLLFARMAAKCLHGEWTLAAPDAYLRKAAINLIRDETRQARRRSGNLHVCAEDVPLSAGDPVATLEARDILARLEATMALLKPRTREIFLAHRIDGFSYGEIAARTGLSVKAVEKHMSRAIAHVSRHLNV
ncbi:MULTISPECIES: RNA polymerase sigma factor [unclassified Novosphingobium]|uniref:RNA polymerase sigma factor n=1 Tax=unclassified Novosphingobium TaxID=2644732 RepID=UPI001356B2DC|nr:MULTISPECIES: RNA polymerase sigma factor [unclassified Novosphingobium]